MSQESEAIPREPRRERRKKRQREASSQTDEEAHDSDQNGDENESFLPSKWQEEITQKINKLLNILPLFEDLKEELTTLKEENARLRKLIETTSNEIKS